MPRILVPLDESELAEEALPWAALIAKALGDSIHLITVWNSDDDSFRRAGIDPGDSVEKIAAAIDGYLAGIAGSPALAGLEVTYEVRLGDAAEQIAEATESDTRMVVIASHARGGIRRAIRGSVADKLIRTLPIPVVVDTHGGVEPGLTNILVTLDGSEEAELALAPARELAKAAGATVHLLRVYNPLSEVGLGIPGATTDLGRIAELMVDSATAYLERIAVEGEVAEVLAGRPLDVIVNYARSHDCNLVVMGTRGHGGLIRLAIGSTADAVVRASDCPVMLVTAPE